MIPMKVVIFYQNGTYFANVVEENGDEHELTRGIDHNNLVAEVKSMAPDAPIEYHEDVPSGK